MSLLSSSWFSPPAPPPPSLSFDYDLVLLFFTALAGAAITLLLQRYYTSSAAKPLSALRVSFSRLPVQKSPQPPQSRWSRPLGLIHKSTFSVRDPAESCEFCCKYLDCEEIEVPDPGLVARGIRWVKLPGGQSECRVKSGDGAQNITADHPTSEFHFIPWGAGDADSVLMGGIDIDGDGIVSGDEMMPITQKFIAELIDSVDGDMKVWSVYANTHVGWCVADLTPMVERLQRDGVPFFGPTRRADGVFQLYLELPYHHFLEVDSLEYDETRTGVGAKPWTEVTGRAAERRNSPSKAA